MKYQCSTKDSQKTNTTVGLRKHFCSPAFVLAFPKCVLLSSFQVEAATGRWDVQHQQPFTQSGHFLPPLILDMSCDGAAGVMVRFVIS